MTPKFRATVRQGKLHVIDRKALDAYVASLKEDSSVNIIIKRSMRTRSDQQNRYYWGAVLPTISEHTGYSVEELHETLKRLFLPTKIVKLGSKEVAIPPSSATINTMEFAEFLDRVISEAATMGISIPSPEQVEY